MGPPRGGGTREGDGRMQMPIEERDARYQRVRDMMDREGFDVLLIAGKGHGWSGRGFFRYFTDFHLWGHDGLILFPRTGEPMLTLTSGGVAAKISQRGWIEDARGDWDVAPGIIAELRRRGLHAACVGLVGRGMILPVGVHDRLREGLPGCEFGDADRAMEKVRAKKSAAELDAISGLWRVATDAMELFIDGLRPGRTQLQLSAPPVSYLHERGIRDYLIFWDGEIPGNNQVELTGTIRYHMEICGPSGHWCEITVLPTYGTVDEMAKRRMEAELDAYARVRARAVPGTTMNTLVDVYEDVLREWGFAIDPSPGHHYDMHGQGLDWIEWPNRAPNDPERFDTPLGAGMYINYHPSRVLLPEAPATGINDGMVITENGGRRIFPAWDMRYRYMV